jgi:hypothetical protein
VIEIDDDDIAWKNDVKEVYSRADNYKEEQWRDVEDGEVKAEHFMDETVSTANSP